MRDIYILVNYDTSVEAFTHLPRSQVKYEMSVLTPNSMYAYPADLATIAHRSLIGCGIMVNLENYSAQSAFGQCICSKSDATLEGLRCVAWHNLSMQQEKQTTM
jgi:hypothetical protein